MYHMQKNVEDERLQYFSSGLFEYSEDECFLDIGAYIGDTLETFDEVYHGKWGAYYAVRRHIAGGANRTLISAILPPRLRSPVGDCRLSAGQPHAVVALFERRDSCF